MPDGVAVERVAQGDESGWARACTAVWARAKARRDGGPGPADVEGALLGVGRRLTRDDGRLLLARRGGDLVGFALHAPHGPVLELFHLGVEPHAWGSGVATALLAAVDDAARAAGAETLGLWVVEDNSRALDLYERTGWTRTGRTSRDGGRIEQRLDKRVGRP